MQLQIPGHAITFDEIDQELVSSHSWSVKRVKNNLYAVTNVTLPGGKHTTQSMHRMIMCAGPRQYVDHRDRHGLHNNRGNLRLCTNKQNHANRAVNKNNTSGYKGVCWIADNSRWRASICIDGKTRYLGSFLDPWDAAQAYNAAALNQWDEFALLNTRIKP